MLFTDGATEAQNMQKEMYQLSNLQRAVEKYSSLRVHDMIHAILQEILGFIGNAEQHDDITLLAFKYNEDVTLLSPEDEEI